MKKLILILCLTLISPNLWGMNPISPVFNYFSNLLDETKAEVKIGKLMKEMFIDNVSAGYTITKNEELTLKIKELASKSPRKNIMFEVYIIDSEIPDEIPFPGGTLLLTQGLLNRLNTEEKIEFILARNIIHQTKKQPMKLIKRQGIYPTLLNQVKLKPNKRETTKILIALRDYLNGIGKLDHFTADREALYLTKSPEKTREIAIELLSNFSVTIWPMVPIEVVDLPDRITKLKELKIKRQ
jgi:hypothetical protein